MTGYKPPYQVVFDQTDNYKTVNIFYVQLAYLTQAEIWLYVTSHLEALSEDIRIFQKFLEYVVLYKHRLFCTLSYPEDASKVNAIHVRFFNYNYFYKISEMNQK